MRETRRIIRLDGQTRTGIRLALTVRLLVAKHSNGNNSITNFFLQVYV